MSDKKRAALIVVIMLASIFYTSWIACQYGLSVGEERGAARERADHKCDLQPQHEPPFWIHEMAAVEPAAHACNKCWGLGTYYACPSCGYEVLKGVSWSDRIWRCPNCLNEDV